MKNSLNQFWQDQSNLVKVAIGYTLVGVIGFIDYLTGYEIAFSIFYLVPIVLVAWFIGKRSGMLIAIFSAAVWGVADAASGSPYSRPFIPYWNTLVRLGFFVIVNHTLFKLKDALKREKDLARRDSLTNVMNARYFIEMSEREIERARRFKRTLTIAYIDLDNFKSVNDRFGHHTGNFLLQTVADVIRKNLREIDMVARLGGDEFVVLFPETGGASVREVIDRLRKLLSDAMEKNGWPVTFSIGEATFTNPPASSDEMLKKADDLMYFVKNNGKNGLKHEVFPN
jgi:diguanylate cyclase (GGDEF)-like protein